MIDTLLARLAQVGTFRALFQVAASLCALATLGTWSAPSPTGPNAEDGRLLALGDTPLAMAYRALNFFGIPHEWVSTVGAYLAANSDRTKAFGGVALLLGCAVTCTLSPTNNLPSLQASTWRVCAVVTVQCSSAGLLTWLALWLVGRGIKATADGTPLGEAAGEAMFDLLHLFFAIIYVPLMSLRLIFDRWNR